MNIKKLTNVLVRGTFLGAAVTAGTVGAYNLREQAPEIPAIVRKAEKIRSLSQELEKIESEMKEEGLEANLDDEIENMNAMAEKLSKSDEAREYQESLSAHTAKIDRIDSILNPGFYAGLLTTLAGGLGLLGVAFYEGRKDFKKREEKREALNELEKFCARPEIQARASIKDAVTSEQFKRVVAMGKDVLPDIYRMIRYTRADSEIGLISAPLVEEIVGDEFKLPDEIRENVKERYFYTKRWLEDKGYGGKND